MKNRLIGGLLFVVFLFGFTTGSTVMQPAAPTQVKVESFLTAGKAQDYVNEQLANGWVLKTWAVDKVHFIVMEKY